MMWRGQNAHRDLMIQVMDDPRALLEIMDRAGVWRAGLVNYPAPDVMGFTETTNAFAARYARANPQPHRHNARLNSRHTPNSPGDVCLVTEQCLRPWKIPP